MQWPAGDKIAGVTNRRFLDPVFFRGYLALKSKQKGPIAPLCFVR
ncbi:hypothetical protein SBA3_2090003 [Candidatus Sulfopaludibacter sp. SbA3]|nr:hypothetical protein SBA3_2090003 [Candidatus Sulfopaludibacter sp. SbA3]